MRHSLLHIASAVALVLMLATAPAFAADDEADSEAPASNPAQQEVRFTAMQEELRVMRGKIEEDDFQIKKLNDTIDKLQRDVDYRFDQLNKPAATAATPAAPADAKATAAADKTKKPAAAKDLKPLSADELKLAKDAGATQEAPKKFAKNDAPKETTAGDGTLHATEGGTPRDAYNAAFKLLNQAKYDDASSAFQGFIQQYPKDPLVGNAYYWMGETHYIQHDYVNAADSFRQGFEIAPNGPKAPDNLLKLAMSLNALKRDKEACIVLGQIVAKFKKDTPGISEKAEQEQKRIACSQ